MPSTLTEAYFAKLDRGIAAGRRADRIVNRLMPELPRVTYANPFGPGGDDVRAFMFSPERSNYIIARRELRKRVYARMCAKLGVFCPYGDDIGLARAHGSYIPAVTL